MNRVVTTLNIIHSLINSFTFHSCGGTETGISEIETQGALGHCPPDPTRLIGQPRISLSGPQYNSSLISGGSRNLKFPHIGYSNIKDS